MATEMMFKYIDESSIDPELICSICNSPFNDPASTPCDHTFCRECITAWINVGNKDCPVCRSQLLLTNAVMPANRIVRSLIDRLQVQCLTCGATRLQKGNIDEHISRTCPRMHVACPSEDIKCPWRGPRDQLEQHIQTCVFQPFRSILRELVVENKRLKEQIEQLDAQMKEHNTETTSSINELSSK